MASCHDDLLARSHMLTREFYARDATQVARECLGKILVHGKTAGRIVEVEAYLGMDDAAAHASAGITNRTKIIFGDPGHAYVYFIYGMYECLNFVAKDAGCVLIRAVEPMCGLPLMWRRRPAAKRIEDLASGPGKLTLAMGITRKLNGIDLTGDRLQVRGLNEKERFEIGVSPRIGITKSSDWPLRFFISGSAFVSR
jgi:DNA-3-methyladenine glycosylase